MRRMVRLSLQACVFLVFLAKGLTHRKKGIAQDHQLAEPEFAEPIQNETVASGREATLTCIVESLGTYKVAWVNFDRQTILTVQHRVITRNTRVSIAHNNNHRTWTLHLRNVRETDAGRYMCQINTEPAKTQIGYLTVVVPPDIIDSETSSEVIARESQNVTLTCRAKGTPTPTIMWRREDVQKFQISKGKTVTEVYGETLEIAKVSRLHMGAYHCIASNGIPPAVSKRIMLKVDFPPMLWVPHQLVGAPWGYETTLECNTEAYPRSINYWTKEDGEMIFPSDKYEANNTEDLYSRKMQLRIKNLSGSDYGIYKCVAKNPLGETESTIRVYATEAPTTIPTTTIKAIYERIEDHTRNKNENHSSHNKNNPSSLIVQEHDKDVKYKSILKSSKPDDNLSLKPPKDWSHSESARSSQDSNLCFTDWRLLTVLHFLLHFMFLDIFWNSLVS